MSKVSVIVPVYNAEEYLHKCLDSIICQTLKDIEILIVDDGSCDNSKKIIDDYIKKDSRIKYFYEKNSGQGCARNLGIKMSKSDYITFVDSDDYIEANMLEDLYNCSKKGDYDIVTCNIITSENKIIKNCFKEIENLIIGDSGPCAKLIRKEFIIDNNLIFPNLRAYEDLAIIPAYYYHTQKVSCVDKELYNYYIRQGSTMNRIVYTDKLEQIFESLEYLRKEIQKVNITNEDNEELEWLYINHLLHAASLRFFKFDNYIKNITKVNKTISEYYPKWYKNKYFRKQSIKYKIVCVLFYKAKYDLLKILLKG